MTTAARLATTRYSHGGAIYRTLIWNAIMNTYGSTFKAIKLIQSECSWLMWRGVIKLIYVYASHFVVASRSLSILLSLSLLLPFSSSLFYLSSCHTH
jgi:hypothetical protein